MLQKLEIMCEDKKFNKKEAQDLLKNIDVNEEFMGSKHKYKFTLLDLAARFSNIEMVKLLLKNGADPNLVYDNESENVLWNLQYADGIDEAENNIRLDIVKVLLEHGANPHLKVDGEDLLDWAIFYYGEEDEGIQAEYRWKFICLLEDYDT